MSRRPSPRNGARSGDSFAGLKAEVERLRRDLAQTHSRIQQLEQGGADPLVAKRLAALEEARLVARGQAVEATVARSRAEAELRTLRDTIEKAPGLAGWLLRRARRRLDE
jgi:hypothetical protein